MVMSKRLTLIADLQDDPNRIINAKQLAAIFPASKMTVWRLEKQGKLPMHVKIGGRNYWNYAATIKAIRRLTETA